MNRAGPGELERPGQSGRAAAAERQLFIQWPPAHWQVQAALTVTRSGPGPGQALARVTGIVAPHSLALRVRLAFKLSGKFCQ